MGAYDDQRGSSCLGDGVASGLLEDVEIIRVLTYVNDLPAVRSEACGGVVVQGQFSRAVDSDVVVVIEDGQPVKPESTGERRGLVANTFFDATVASDAPSAVVHEILAELRSQHPFCDSHANPVGDTLAQRSRRYLDGRRDADLGVTGRLGMRLAKRPNVLDAQVVAEDVRQPVLQHRRVTVAQDEPVTVAPTVVGGIVAHYSCKERYPEWGQGHRRAAVTGLGRGGCVHRQGRNLSDRSAFEFARTREQRIDHGYESSDWEGTKADTARPVACDGGRADTSKLRLNPGSFVRR